MSLIKRLLLSGLPAAVMLLTVECAPESPPTPPAPAVVSTPAASGMSAMAATALSQELAPTVKGYANGGEVLFIHTEASDPQVAAMLTRMMGPQVVLAPQLALVPETALSRVYVFTNGVSGGGPFGFQPDVFDSLPGDPSYSPLRGVHLVAWQQGTAPQELRSAEEVRAAASQGQVIITRPGAVVNMPILAWPGGHR